MPRKAAPHTTQAVLARAALKKYLADSRLTARELAQRAGIGQPTLSKFLTGFTKSVTDDIGRVLEYAEIKEFPGIQDKDEVADNDALRIALTRAWDGTTEHAKLLAAVIEAVGPVLATPAANLRRSKP